MDAPLSSLPGVGPTREGQLQELGLFTLHDLLFDAPFRYETVEREVAIRDLVPESTVCIHARVVSKLPIRTPRFKSMLKVKVADETGTLDLTWFNNSFMLSSLSVGESYYFTGKVNLFKNKLAMTNPTVERAVPEFGSLVPVYHESSEITSRFLRKLIKEALETTSLIDEPLMVPMYQRLGLMDIKTALTTIHRPNTSPQPSPLKGEGVYAEIKTATKRLAFDELFFLIRDVLTQKNAFQQSKPFAKLEATNQEIKEFEARFPYTLTPSQKEAIQAIAIDLVQPHPMHRLIQGEVGSGKTTVAAFALWIAGKTHPPAILICPTKILAQQHFETLTKIFSQHTKGSLDSSLGMTEKNSPVCHSGKGGDEEHYPESRQIRIGLYTGKEKSIDADILVGTHALFNVKGLKPSLVVIDEEHRFGVSQRETFFKGTKKPHFLSMTATPIPRTVALTALADRDVSFITPHKSNDNIKTWVVPSAKRASSERWIEKELTENGGQALIVCPFIEESMVDTLFSVKSATKEFERLKKVFPHRKLLLLHGRVGEDEKQHVFDLMMKGKADILVATPVVEVGVDLPKASIMVIEGAERYGLAGLHQLRGRVGRRGQAAYCLLFTSNETDSTTRLEHFAQTYDGNALAEYDLKHRGSGELLGIRQHGFDTLKFASWSDTSLIELAKQEAEHFL